MLFILGTITSYYFIYAIYLIIILILLEQFFIFFYIGYKINPKIIYTLNIRITNSISEQYLFFLFHERYMK